jgi:hypothetical protein
MLASPPRPLQHPARTFPGTASAAMALADTTARVAAEPIADREGALRRPSARAVTVRRINVRRVLLERRPRFVLTVSAAVPLSTGRNWRQGTTAPSRKYGIKAS